MGKLFRRSLVVPGCSRVTELPDRGNCTVARANHPPINLSSCGIRRSRSSGILSPRTGILFARTDRQAPAPAWWLDPRAVFQQDRAAIAPAGERPDKLIRAEQGTCTGRTEAVARPQTIQIYLPSGNPAGIRIASLTTRTVRVFDVPRSLLGEFLKEPESRQVGLYFLFGAAETDERPQAYVGQSGNVGFRLQQHAASKDFWNKAMVAVSLTNEWTSPCVSG